MLAGLCSGLTEGVFINPFEVVKVRLQTEQQQFKEVKHVKNAGDAQIRTFSLRLECLFETVVCICAFDPLDTFSNEAPTRR